MKKGILILSLKFSTVKEQTLDKSLTGDTMYLTFYKLDSSTVYRQFTKRFWGKVITVRLDETWPICCPGREGSRLQGREVWGDTTPSTRSPTRRQADSSAWSGGKWAWLPLHTMTWFPWLSWDTHCVCVKCTMLWVSTQAHIEESTTMVKMVSIPTTSESLLLFCCFLSLQGSACPPSLCARLTLPSLKDTWIRVQGE